MWMQKTVSKISQFVLSYFYIVSINKQNLYHEYIKHLKKNGKKYKCQAHIRTNPCPGAARSCRRRQIEKLRLWIDPLNQSSEFNPFLLCRMGSGFSGCVSLSKLPARLLQIKRTHNCWSGLTLHWEISQRSPVLSCLMNSPSFALCLFILVHAFSSTPPAKWIAVFYLGWTTSQPCNQAGSKTFKWDKCLQTMYYLFWAIASWGKLKTWVKINQCLALTVC